MRKIWFAIKILALIGILLAVYLYYHFLNPNLSSICTISDNINCNAVTKGSLSTLFGLSVPLIGLVGYIAILFSAILQNKKFLLGMALFGVIFCLRITFLEIFAVHVICPVCLACQVDMLIVFCLALVLFFNKKAA